MIQIAKFGSSVCPTEADRLQLVELVHDAVRHYNPRNLIAVVSALKGVTDQTVDDIAKGDPRLMDGLYGGVCPEYSNHNVAGRLTKPEAEQALALSDLYQTMYGKNTAVANLPGRRFLLAGNHNPLYSIPDLEGTVRRTKTMLLDMPQVIFMAGFTATDDDGQIYCMGKGSSDNTAIIMAYATGASRVVLAKDEDGVYCNFGCEDQKLQERMTRQQVADMGYKVVNSSALTACPPMDTELVVGHYSNLLDLLDGKGPCTKVSLN